MTKAFAQEVASRGITANCVAPGFIRTAMTSALDEKQQAAINGRIPMGRMGEGSESGQLSPSSPRKAPMSRGRRCT